MTATIVGLGEALFDLFPDSEALGGAPLNMAVHAQQLGNQGVVASRIGDDQYGQRIRHALTAFGLDTRWLQQSSEHPTGIVRVAMKGGEPEYEIVRDVAWDFLEFDASWQKLASTCDGVCFGTLAQRSPTSRRTIEQFVAKASQAVRLFDVNLRQHYFDPSLLEHSLQLCSAVKLNADELEVLRDMLQLDSATPADRCREILERFDLSFVAWTRGALGTTVVDRDAIHSAPPVKIDTRHGTPVGAGDATAAAILHGYLAHWPWQHTLQLANALGAYVATQPGACPTLPSQILELLG